MHHAYIDLDIAQRLVDVQLSKNRVSELIEASEFVDFMKYRPEFVAPINTCLVSDQDIYLSVAFGN
jgi:hypothetical protein